MSFQMNSQLAYRSEGLGTMRAFIIEAIAVGQFMVTQMMALSK